jgi:mRNA interferase HigB
MRIITRTRLVEAAAKHPKAKPTLEHWHNIVRYARWRNFAETRKTFAHADQVTVASKRTVTVFNLSNDFRLITAIHYNRGLVFILRFLTHAEYDRDNWKHQL